MKKCPLILGRHFLATRKSVINVHEGKLILRVGDEQVVFDVYRIVNSPLENDECLIIDTIDQAIDEYIQTTSIETPLEICESDVEEIDEYHNHS